MAVVLIAVGMGCFFGIRAAGSAVKQHQAAQEESRQELLEASRVEESAQAQAAVAALFETESTEETESTYTKEEALNDMVEDTLAGMTLEQKVAGLFFVTPEQLTGVSQVVAAGDATRESLEKYPVGGLIYFAQNIQSENQLKEMLSNTASYSLFPLFFGVDEEGGKVEGRARHGAEVDAEHHLHDREDHAEHDEDGEVGEHQQTNALKHTVPISFFFCVDRMSDACSGNGGRSIAHAAAVHSLLNCMKTRRSICLASSRQL